MYTSSFSQWTRFKLALPLLLTSTTTLLSCVSAQFSTQPFNYPGMPTGDYSPAWQSYYEVTEPLPNVTFTLPRSFAGSVSVDRPEFPDNTLFFWAFEKEDGSLTAAANERSDQPWIIWLNGGPGSSSLYGLFQELGPLRIGLNNTVTENPWSWHKQADIFFIDQPVGTGLSTVTDGGFVADEDQVGLDFARFLENVVSVFPSLRTRPLYLTGESYAGVYIPYISKTLFGMQTPPVNIAKIAIGNGAMGSWAAFEQYPVMSVLDTYPQMINFDPDVYAYFAEQWSLCGYNLSLSYPQTNGPFPSLELPGYFAYQSFEKTRARLKSLVNAFNDGNTHGGFSLPPRNKRQEANYPKPELTGKLNTRYGCWLLEELLDFATNYTAPWKDSNDGINIYDLSDALDPHAWDDPDPYLNQRAVRTALHAPTHRFQTSISYPFGGSFLGDPSPKPVVFFSELASNVTMVLYSGNDDALVAHRGTELVIQNTTFGGIQGFTQPPSTPWMIEDGTFAGLVHQERGITYVLFDGAGHMVPTNKPEAAFYFLREFVLGDNKTGSVNEDGSIVSGQDEQYLDSDGIIFADEVFQGSYSTESTATWAESQWNNWKEFMATRTFIAVETSGSNGNGNDGGGSDATRATVPLGTFLLTILMCTFLV